MKSIYPALSKIREEKASFKYTDNYFFTIDTSHLLFTQYYGWCKNCLTICLLEKLLQIITLYTLWNENHYLFNFFSFFSLILLLSNSFIFIIIIFVHFFLSLYQRQFKWTSMTNSFMTQHLQNSINLAILTNNVFYIRLFT